MIIMEYGSSAAYDRAKFRLKEEGLDIEVYLEVFGYPDKYKDMKIDPAWFNPVLPGMEDFADVVMTTAQAEDLLETKKKEAFVRDNGDSFFVELTEAEAETYLAGDDYDIDDEMTWLHEDLRMTIDELIAVSDEWHIDASNLDWRGSTGEKDTSFEDSGEVLAMFICYGDYSLKIEKENIDDDDFTITCYHHDCPMGSVFEFKAKEKK